MDTTAGKHAGDRGDQAGRPASRIKIGHPWLPPLAITTLALALRIYQLGTESLWIDEGYSIEDARNLNFRLGVQDVRPLYNIILSLWLHLGESEFVLRLPAALLGATAVLAVYLLGRRIASERAGFFAAGLMAVSPLHVNHSQEVRMYSLVTLLVLLAMYEFFLFLSARRTSHLAGCLVFTALSIATFPPAALLILVQNLAVLRGTPRLALRNWFIAQVLLLAPCIPLFLRTVEASKYLAPEAGTGPSALDAVRITGSFSLLASGPAGSMTWYAFSAYTFGSLALIAFGFVQMQRRRDSQARPYLILLIWLVIPLALTAELARITGAQWLPRYVIYTSPAYFLLLGLSIHTLPGAKLKYMAAAAILILPVAKLGRYYQRPTRPEWREAVRLIERNEQPGDVIAIYRPGNGCVFRYYYRGKQPWQEVGWPKLQKKRPWTEERVAGVIGDLPLRYRRVWLVMSQYDPKAPRAMERYISGKYKLLEKHSYAEIEMILFERCTPGLERPSHDAAGMGSFPATSQPHRIPLPERTAFRQHHNLKLGT